MPESISKTHQKKRHKKSNIPSIGQGLFVLLFISIVVYLLARSIFIVYADYLPVEKVLAVFFLLAEMFIMFHAIGYLGTIYRLNKLGMKEEPTPQFENNAFPAVAVLIPARHEKKEVIENTLISCHNMVYPNKTIYLLDDSSLPEFKREAEEVAKKYNVRIFRREERHGAKAGVINDCVKGLTEKYIAIFDADQNPLPTFLNRLVPLLEKNGQLAFVQTPQFYSNMDENRITFAANMQQAVFYEYVCEAKSTNQAMICCGTNVVIRRDALNDVGGFDESTVTEDFATSFKFHRQGWQSRYDNQVNTYGMAPTDLAGYFTQQNRWALGNVTVFRHVLGMMFKDPRSLSFIQWWEYIITGSYYLIGWAYMFLFLCPVAFLFFNIPSFFMNPVVYSLTFLPYFILSMSIFYVSMLSRRVQISQLLKGQLLAVLTLPVYMRASLLGFLGVRGTFQITSKDSSQHHGVPYRVLWPQLLFWALNLSAVTWGINRFVFEQTASVMINVLWAGYHCIVLSSIFYYNE